MSSRGLYPSVVSGPVACRVEPPVGQEEEIISEVVEVGEEYVIGKVGVGFVFALVLDGSASPASVARTAR